MVEISTSILTVEKEKATKTFYDLEVAGTDYYHIDIMDGKFVEKNTEELMYEYASTIKQISNLPLDVHLMVEDIKPHIEKYIPLEPSIITFHYEACKNKKEVLEYINCLKQKVINDLYYKNISIYGSCNDSRTRKRWTKTNSRNINKSKRIKKVY